MKPPAIPITIPNPSYLADHRAEGRSILPAVEALQYLARCAAENRPGLDVFRSRLAEFVRFLELPKNQPEVEARVDLDVSEQGFVTARLLTRTRAGTAGITRSKEHVQVEYGAARPLDLPPWDTLAALEGICCSFDAGRLYEDLVPFGPSFQNVEGTVHLAGSGAAGRVAAASHPAPMEPLGNPFVLDGAFHLACAWGQRFAGRLTFPTGYIERVILRPCRTGDEYLCRAIPVSSEPDVLRFDLYLFDDRGELREACLGVEFRDVSQGRMKAADWVRENTADPLQYLRAACAGLAVVELDTLAPCYDKAYTARERGRDLEMGARRSRSFAGARMALKHLARRIAQDVSTPADHLQTVSEDRVHPLLPLPGGDPIKYCAAAHDDRFAVAAAADHPVGIDVEKLSDRVLVARRIYMSGPEQALVEESPLGPVPAALRIWTIKESAAKALDIPLPKAFSRVEVTEMAENRCTAQIDGRATEALCATVDEHVFTLLGLPEQTQE